MLRTLHRATGPGLALALATCHAPPSGDSAFGYLAAKYDRDGDGAVLPDEYTGSSEAFARLDADGDGRLSPVDFPDERWTRDLGIRDVPPDVRERLDVPALVDDVDDAVSTAYAAWPDRLYLVGADGRIAYHGGRGPFGFDPDGLARAIADALGRE